MVPILHDGRNKSDQPNALPSSKPEREADRHDKRKGLVRRLFITSLSSALIVLTFLGICLTSFWAILALGPIHSHGLEPYIANAISDKIGGSLKVAIGATYVSQGKSGPSILLEKLSIQTQDGQSILSSPRAEIDFDIVSLLKGDLRASHFDLIDLDLKLIVLPDGELAIAAGSEPIRLNGSHFANNKTSPKSEQMVEPIQSPPIMAHAQSLIQSLFTLVSGQESPISALKKFSISKGRLVVDNKLKEKTARFNNLELNFERTGQTALLSLASDGVKGRLHAQVLLRDTELGAHQAVISVSELSAEDLIALSGKEGAALDFDMPLQAEAHFELDGAGVLRDAHGSLSLGSGLFYLRHEDFEPLIIDKITGTGKWNFEDNKFEIGQTHFYMDGTYLALNGQLVPDTSESKWFFDLTGGPQSHIGADWPGDNPIEIPHLEIAGSFKPESRQIDFDKFELGGPEVSLALAASANWDSAQPSFKIRGATGRMQARPLIRLWPAFVAPASRAWFIEHVRSGQVENARLWIDLDSEALREIAAGHGASEQNVLAEFDVNDAAMDFLPGVPPLTGIAGTGKITGTQAFFNARQGQLVLGDKQIMSVSEGHFEVPDLDPRYATANLKAKVSGKLDAVANFLGREALKGFGGMPIDTNVAHGQVDGNVTLDIKLHSADLPDRVAVKVNAKVTNFVYDDLIGSEKFDQAVLNVSADKNGIRATGQGRMFGAPASMEIKRIGNGPAESNISMTIDDAARNKMGWLSAPIVAGPVGAKIYTDLSKLKPIRAQIELDLGKASIEGLLPSYSKPAGRAARANFAIASAATGVVIDQLNFDGGNGVSAQGALTLDTNGNLASGKFSQLRLSPGDDMKLDFETSKQIVRINVRASTLDSRPFLRQLSGVDPSHANDNFGNRDIDLDLRANLLTGHNRQSISAADLRYVGHGSLHKQLAFTGKLGKDSVGAQLIPGGAGTIPNIRITSKDGGSLLSFLDFYRHLEGGELTLMAQIQDKIVEGYLHILNFQIKDEPGLKRLVSETTAQRESIGAPIDTGLVQFNKLQVAFTRWPNKIELRDGVIYGPQIGLSGSGTLDYAANRVQVNGTFVPAYGLNNLFAQIPLFGTIVGGGSHEGLFAVNFQIAGPASAPVLTINPLSAIAPGILRKMFGTIDPNVPENLKPPQSIEPRTSPQPSMPLSINPAR
jgi:hypothetical protein